MALLRKLLSAFTGGGRSRPTRTTRTRSRGSTTGGLVGAVKGFLRGSGRA